ncbi:nucleotidyl transferase AbiEii/AbiGii toxin family protein [uncultured Roseibium sp.]|uniref:nucleotidyl transferase AbiEii/AbiGii toxin family protein n=1 Tax=uncultured Roseibium sp. TaxID=1936171 RepID=UPI0026359459|nr:nucleotidyl transferase AbiEii/AbiGii toxin family protein [uncultured Roseibium sp.]
MNTPNPSRWEELFSVACQIIDLAGGDGIVASWSFGGGTALMLQIDHRESHDIDIFIDDPQVLPLLNPETQDYALTLSPSAYDTDGTRSLKLSFAEIGEIDFICCGHLTENPTSTTEVLGRPVELETSAEIIAKKVFYRGGMIQPRDMFDIAASIRHGDADVLERALSSYADKCAIAREAAARMSPQLALAGMTSLQNIRPMYQDLPATAQKQVVEFLARIEPALLQGD